MINYNYNFTMITIFYFTDNSITSKWNIIIILAMQFKQSISFLELMHIVGTRITLDDCSYKRNSFLFMILTIQRNCSQIYWIERFWFLDWSRYHTRIANLSQVKSLWILVYRKGKSILYMINVFLVKTGQARMNKW